MASRLKDIAAELNCSVATVSKAIQDYPDISEATKRRVRAKCLERGYQPNWTARSLKTRRSRIIGMVLPHLRHSFFQEAYQAIVEEVGPSGYTVFIGVSLNDPETEEREVRHLQARQADGLILASARPASDPGFVRRLANGGTPTVLLDRFFDDLDLDFVGVDDVSVGAIAVEHLIGKGRRRVAYLRGPSLSTSRLREEGYRNALLRNGLAPNERWIGRVLVDGPDAERSIERVILSEPRPDAVFCYNDPVAASVMRVANRRGLAIPEDLAVVGSGAMKYSDLFYRPLTTVDQRSRVVGRTVAKRIVELIECNPRPDPQRVLVEPELIVRASTSA